VPDRESNRNEIARYLTRIMENFDKIQLFRSRLFFLGQALSRQFTYDILGHKQKYKAYAAFVNLGVDEETQKYFSGKQLPSIIGETGFKQWIFDKILEDESLEIKSKTLTDLKFIDIVTIVANKYKKDTNDILKLQKGPQLENIARKVCMYLCQQLTGKSQKEIAKYFNLHNTGSVSYTTHMIRVRIREDKKFAKKSMVSSII